MKILPRVFQYHSSVIAGDAIGYSILALHQLLLKHGTDSRIFCSDDKTGVTSYLEPVSKLANSVIKQIEDCVLIIHYSFYDESAKRLARLPIKKILVYHNITPGSYFREAEINWLADILDSSRVQVKNLSDAFNMSIGDSDFNSNELRSYGFRNIRTIPVFVNTKFFSDPAIEEVFFQQMKVAARVNFVFVGRFVPNKKIEDTISVLAQYCHMFDRDVMLHLVGKIWHQGYYESIIEYGRQRGLGALIRSHIDVEPIRLKTILSAADAFVSMSEHEGFMVPIIECFAVGCPVIALNAGAVGETMGDGGFMLHQPDASLAATYLRMLKLDASLRDLVVAGQRRRAFDFRADMTLRLWIQAIHEVSSGD